MREPIMILASGVKRVGKTYQTCHEIQDYITPKPNREARKVLIYDVNREYNDEQIRENGCTWSAKVLDIKDLPAFARQKRVEVRRILAVDEYGKRLPTPKMVERLNEILQVYTGGLLLLEDINKYLVGNSSVDIVGMMATNAHVDLDIYIHLQSLAKLTTTMWQNSAVVRFHKQLDRVKRYEDRLSNPQLFHVAQKLVDMECMKNKRFFVYIHIEENIIRGKFSKKTFQLACYSYLLDNQKMISAAQQRFGGGIKSRNKAISYLINDLMKYYGN